MGDRTRLPLPETPYKAGHYCNKCGQYGSPTAQHTRPNSGQLCNYLAVQAPRFTDSDMHAYAAAQSAADNADLLDHKKSAPLCDKHKPTGGARSNIDTLMKRCQTGCGGPGALNNANDLLAECYGALGALREDAERYRWLREQAIDGAPGVPVIAMPNGMRSGYYLNFDTADFAIDAARKAAP